MAELSVNPQTKIVMVVEYDGTKYCGFQFQLNSPTIQEELEKALYKLTGEKIRVVGSSRTDAGVHAKGQVVSFRTNSALKPETYVQALNHYLPQDIAVLEAYQVNSGFNVQRQAVSRRYHYYILNRKNRSPLWRGFAYHVRTILDIGAMNQAAECLLGEHDLASFVTDYSQSQIKSTIKKILTARITQSHDLVIFEIEGNSFLPHQVRNMMGALLRVGLGKLYTSEFKNILEAKKMGLAGPTVPARGLFLIQVNYPRPLGEYNENL